MSSLPEPIERASAAFDSLPGLGPRASLRYVSWLATQSREVILGFARSIESLANSIHRCRICHQWTDQDPCRICRDPSRDATLLCLVATSQDIRPLEDSGAFKGKYHVLNGTIDPLEGRGSEQLTLPSLVERLSKQEPKISEVLIALDADVPGDATTMFLQRALAPFAHVKVSRLARGLPSGASLEYADPLTLMDAITHRRTTEPPKQQ